MDLKLFRKVNNVRELGGYPTRDGHKVKKGIFYRSGAPGYFDASELKECETMHLKAVIDFRSEDEVIQLPDPEIDGARYYHISALTDEAGNEIDLSPEGLQIASEEQFFSPQFQNKFIENFYGRLPFSPAYRLLFQVIRANEVPVLFHCTAGKDRTGVGAMLILLALNVDEKIVMEDYMKTNAYRKMYIDQLLEIKKDAIQKYPAAEKVYQSFEGVVEDSLLCSMHAIKDKYGTYENYFKTVLQLDEEDLADLRRRYTE